MSGFTVEWVQRHADPSFTAEQYAALPAGVRAALDRGAQGEYYTQATEIEERRAWDGYAAGYAAAWTDGDPGSHSAASYADRLLSERRKRFPRPGT